VVAGVNQEECLRFPANSELSLRQFMGEEQFRGLVLTYIDCFYGNYVQNVLMLDSIGEHKKALDTMIDAQIHYIEEYKDTLFGEKWKGMDQELQIQMASDLFHDLLNYYEQKGINRKYP